MASADSGKQNSRILSYRYHWRCSDKPGGGVGAGGVAEGCGEPGSHRGNLSSGPVGIFRTNTTPGVSAANLKQRFFCLHTVVIIQVINGMVLISFFNIILYLMPQ